MVSMRNKDFFSSVIIEDPILSRALLNHAFCFIGANEGVTMMIRRSQLI